MNLALVAVAAAAFGVAPSVGYVYPPVLPVGVVTEVHLGGYDFTPDVELHSLHRCVTIEKLAPPGEFLVPEPPYWFGAKSRTKAFPIPREVPARINVTKEMSPGIARWQVANAGGASGCAAFLVEAGNVVVEKRRRNEPQTLQSLPVTIAARLSRIAEVDDYNFTASRDGPVTVELIARRIGSNFNGVIEVRESGKVRLADVVDTEGRDCELTFAVEATKTYSVRVFDVDFRGNQAFVYALRLTSGPRVLLTRPASGHRGQSRDVMFIGYGLDSGTAQLEQVTRTVDFPDDHQPTFSYSLESPAGTTSVELGLDDVDEIVEPEHTEFSGPCAVNGTLDSVGDEDRYTFEMTKGDVWCLSVEARVLGSPLDPILRVLAPDGSELAKNDDAGGSVDCEVEVTAAVDGPHTIVIGNLSEDVGTLLSIYRLVVKPALPDFSLSIPQRVSFEAGGTASVAVQLSRSGGFDEEVVLEAMGLPAGVTAPAKLRIPADKNELKFELTTAKDCATTSTYLRMVGVGTIGSDSVTRVAMAGAEGNLCPRDPAKQRVPSMLLTRTMKAPLSISWVGRETQHQRPRGSTFPAELEINRQEGYDGEIWLMMRSEQSRHRQGIRGPIMKVPAGAQRVIYPVFLPEWLETDRTSRMVIAAMAKVVDAQRKDRYVMAPSGRLCMILEGSLMKVDGGDAEIEARPGDSFEVAVDILRRPKFTENVTLEITAADDVDDLFKTAPVVVSMGETRATIRVATTADPRLYPEQELRIRATALQEGKWLAVSETAVTVVFGNTVVAHTTAHPQ